MVLLTQPTVSFANVTNAAVSTQRLDDGIFRLTFAASNMPIAVSILPSSLSLTTATVPPFITDSTQQPFSSSFPTTNMSADNATTKLSPLSVMSLTAELTSWPQLLVTRSHASHHHHHDNHNEIEFESMAWLTFQGVHVCLATASLFVNALAIVAVHGFAVRVTPHLQLLTSLCLAHTLALWGVATLYFHRSVCQQQLHASLLTSAHNAIAFTLLLWALLQSCITLAPTHASRLFKTRQTWITINVLWTVALFGGHVHFLISLSEAGNYDFEAVYCRHVQDRSVGILLSALVLYFIIIVMSTAAYIAAIRRINTSANALHFYQEPLNSIQEPEVTDNMVVAERQQQQPQSQPQSTQPQETRMSNTDVITGAVLYLLYSIAWGPYFAAKIYQSLHANLYEDENYWVVLQGTMLAPLSFCLVCPLMCGVRVGGMDVAYLRLYHSCRSCFSSTCRKLRRTNSTTLVEQDPSCAPLQAIESIC